MKKEDLILSGLLPEKKCAVCGKTMCRVYWKDYVYKKLGKFFCGYNCMRNFTKQRELNENERISG